jgi:RimJ/RimL family protein N-acetyltransferase
MIYADRIRLRAIERTDLPSFVGFFNDPEVRENLSVYLPFSQAAEEKWFEENLSRQPEEQAMAIEVHDAGGWTLIGSCGFMNLKGRDRSAEVGISIGNKAYWNQGYGREAMLLLLKHGFNTLNLNRIYLQVYETNERAIHVYEKAGFVLEGRQRQARYRDGKYIDVLLMSVIKSEWLDHNL